MIEIPYKELPPDTLERLIEEFITREGTDYGELEYSLEAKTAQIIEQLKQKKVIITYDQETETCNIITAN